MAERDYPVGHPAGSDYKGEPYTPPRAPFSEDFAPGHGARGGHNISQLDTPDGLHAATVDQWQANAKRTAEAEPQATGEAAPDPPDTGQQPKPQTAQPAQPSPDSLTPDELNLIATLREATGVKQGTGGSQ